VRRKFTRIAQYLADLEGDIYPQPPDPGHTRWAEEVLQKWLPALDVEERTLLDIGCGSGFCAKIVRDAGWQWRGVTLGDEDVRMCRAQKLKVDRADFSFLPYEGNTFSVAFARHALEHSPMPLLTLMEWRRVTKHFLILVNPDPAVYGYEMRNHYSTMIKPQLLCILERAGWVPIMEDDTEPTEIRLLCGRKEEPA